jgi:hypothetical protein
MNAKILVMLAVLGLGACSDMRYRKPDTSSDEMQQDLTECQGQLSGRPRVPGTDSLRDQMDQCMVERGYYVGW